MASVIMATIRSILPRLALGLALVLVLAGGGTGPTWEHWLTIPGIFDVAGPRHDGSLVVAGSDQVYLVDATGSISPLAKADDVAGAEAYLTVSPGHAVSGAGCSFPADDVFVLRLHAPLGITRLDGQGHRTSFANVTGIEALNGIVFDTTGKFGFRLLVTGPLKGKTAVAAIDCTGAVEFITRTAPVLEGGLAVAPADFAAYGGDLIAPDELSGKIYAIAPDGTVSVVATPRLPFGPDTGVESVAFVPPGFTRGGAVYYTDRITPSNPFPGTDSLLRLPSSSLAAAGVRDGDLLAATEGGATMVALSCHATCQELIVVGTASSSHGEGHITFTVNKISSPAASPVASPARLAPAPNRGPVTVIAILVALFAVAVATALRRRRSRARSER
jgi:hypothetical protein